MAAWMSLSRGSPHPDWCLHFESHHPTRVKRGMVRCLYDMATGIFNTQDNLQKEVDNLATVLKQNGCPAKFIHNASAPPSQETVDISSHDEGQDEEKGPLVVIPYVA